MPIPSFFIAGASVSFEAVTPDYGSVGSYTGLIELINETGKHTLASASTTGETHTFTAAPTVTVEWAPGRYAFRLLAVKSGERWPVQEGWIEIKPDFNAVASLDARTHVRKVVEAIEAVLERRASSEHLELNVPSGDGTVALKMIPFTELMALRDKYKSELRSQEIAAGLVSGRGSSRVIRVRY